MSDEPIPTPPERLAGAPPAAVDPGKIPALVITQADLQELDLLLGELPMKYGMPLLQFINQRRLRQQQAAAPGP